MTRTMKKITREEAIQEIIDAYQNALEDMDLNELAEKYMEWSSPAVPLYLSNGEEDGLGIEEE